MTAIPSSVFGNTDVRLRVWFNGQLLTPDQRIAAVGYAHYAAKVADGGIATASLADASVTAAKLAASSVDLSTTTVTGTLPVSKGGTGTATPFTQGSVVFAGASGVYSQNNAALNWDNTNQSLQVGTTQRTSNSRLTVQDGHIVAGQTRPPTVAVVGAGVASAALVSGTDAAGRVIFATNGAAAPGDQVTVSFAYGFASVPVVVATPMNSATAALNVYAVPSPTGITIGISGSPANNTTYTVSYMVMESVQRTAAVSSTFTLDSLSTAPAAAYGLRRLLSSYTGPLIRVRRGGDNAELDIGTTSSGDLDTNTLLNFADPAQLPPLDLVPGATAAYGVRKLRSVYAGPLVQIRRINDNAYKDFYPDTTGWLSLSSTDGSGTTLQSWITNNGTINNNNGYIRRWYDQSGNGIDLITTAGGTPSYEFRIFNAGVMDTVNGRPSPYSTGFQGYHGSNNAIGYAGATASVFATWSFTYDGGNNLHCVSLGNQNNNAYNTAGLADAIQAHGYGVNRVDAIAGNSALGGYSAANNVLVQCSSIFDGTNHSMYCNGTIGTSAAYATPFSSMNTILIGMVNWLGGNGFSAPGYYSEIIIYLTGASGITAANRQIIEQNQARTFSIPTVADAYVKTWYDQTGAVNLTNGTTTTQPRIVSGGTLDTANGKPTIRFLGGVNGIINTLARSALDGNRLIAAVMSVDAGSGFLLNGATTTSFHSDPAAVPTLMFSTNAQPDVQNGVCYVNSVVKNPASTAPYFTPTLQTISLVPSTGFTTVWDNLGNDRGFAHHLHGYYSELVIFTSAVSDPNRLSLETSQRTYFGTP